MTRAERLANYDARARKGDALAARLAAAMRIGEDPIEVREFEVDRLAKDNAIS